MILSDLVEPEIPAYPFWKLSVALNPSSAWTYLQSIISGLYALSEIIFGLFWPTTQILLPLTSNFINSV